MDPMARYLQMNIRAIDEQALADETSNKPLKLEANLYIRTSHYGLLQQCFTSETLQWLPRNEAPRTVGFVIYSKGRIARVFRALSSYDFFFGLFRACFRAARHWFFWGFFSESIFSQKSSKYHLSLLFFHLKAFLRSSFLENVFFSLSLKKSAV